ncbi:hypothetical protein [Corynebacterium diphtheriae]|uniref:hypothetical protein n=1 Tax=Corynebacterium diphtheriae TaxID=1717 RepID=UPI0021632F89|nr:hypothetical protein [Corynebacterium diphtheriae]
MESLHFHQRNQLIDAVGASTFQGRHIGFLAQFDRAIQPAPIPGDSNAQSATYRATA